MSNFKGLMSGVTRAKQTPGVMLVILTPGLIMSPGLGNG